MSIDQVRDRLAEVLTDPLAEEGLDLEAVEVTPAGRRRLVRVAVDKDGGITLDDIAAAARAVSRLLDESDVMGERPYTLEVTSPGTDRPLTLPRHWRRNQGRLVTVTSREGAGFTGRIVRAGEGSALLVVEGEEREVVFDHVAKARVQLEFSRKER